MACTSGTTFATRTGATDEADDTHRRVHQTLKLEAHDQRAHQKQALVGDEVRFDRSPDGETRNLKPPLERSR
jgi:hypothetical protein